MSSATRKILTEIPHSFERKLNELEHGRIYWTYAYNRHRKNGRIMDYKPPFEVRFMYGNLEYRSGNEWTRLYNTHHLKGYFETEEACIAHHDDGFKSLGNNVNTQQRAKLYKKLIKKQKIERSPIEMETMAWLKTLAPRQIEYVQWIKTHYDGQIK